MEKQIEEMAKSIIDIRTLLWYFGEYPELLERKNVCDLTAKIIKTISQIAKECKENREEE